MAYFCDHIVGASGVKCGVLIDHIGTCKEHGGATAAPAPVEPDAPDSEPHAHEHHAHATRAHKKDK